ncbi:MAG: hypothetical protein DMG14_17550 [Acidobacteria bacterium]|nr:MAG: hypothetical protein DMG14_17550 [Acidobacteriota bacterium]
MKREAIRDVHGSDREIGLVISVGARSIGAHGYAARQVGRLESAVHCGSGRIQDVEPAGRGIGFRAEHLVAAPAYDQVCVAGGIGIDGHNVVAECPAETRRRCGRFHGDLLVQVDVLGWLFSQRIYVHRIDERLHVHIENLGWLRLGTNVGQKQPVAANQRR